MKLEGSLDAFSLPDIFQLLSYTKKTGGLRLQHADAHGVVYFTDGTVTGASGEGGRQTLARRLIGLGLVDDDAVTAAVEAAGADGSSPGVVASLVAAGVVTPDAASRIAFEQLHDAVFELLRWPSGDFQFAVDQSNPDDVGLRLAPDDVVTRASEHKIRWAAAASVIPSPEVVPNLIGSTDAESTLRAGDWPVLRLVDGRRKVSEIVELTGAGQLATVVTLADLVDRGLVEVRGADAPNPVEDVVRRMALLAPVESAAPAPVVVTDGADEDEAPAPSAPEATPEAAPVAAPPVVEAPVEPVAETAAPVVEPPAAVADLELAPEPEDAPEAEPLAAVASTVVTVAEPETTSADAVHDTLVDPLAGLGPSATAPRLGGAHTPGDVVPPRAEPFLASRRPDYAEPGPTGLRSTTSAPSAPRSAGGAVGNAAVATAPVSDGLIERDPSVNRSLLLRLIAGVRGL